MHTGFPQDTRASSSVWSAPAYLENEYVPQGYSIVHTAQPGFYTTMTPNPCPMTSADAYQYQYHPVIFHAKHLVPIVQQILPHQNMLYLQHAAILEETSERHEEIFQRRIKERDDERTAAKIRNAKSSKRYPHARSRLPNRRILAEDPMDFRGKRKAPNFLSDGVVDSALVHEERRRLLGNQGLTTPTMEFQQEETGNQAESQSKSPKTSDTRENFDPSSTTVAEDSTKQLGQKDNSKELSTPLNEKTKVSSPGFPSNEIEGLAHDPAGLRTSENISTFGKVEDSENLKLSGSKIKNTHSPVFGKTVVPVSEAATSLTKSQTENKQELTPQKIDVASHNQDKAFPPVDTISDQTTKLQSLPHESGNSHTMSAPNKLIDDLEFPKLDALEQTKSSLSENQKTIVAPEITYKNVLLKEEDAPISKAKNLAKVAKQKKKLVAESQGPHRNNQTLNSNLVKPNARASANGFTAGKQLQNHITKSAQNPRNNQEKSSSSPKSPVIFRSIDATNPSDQVANSKTVAKDHNISSSLGSLEGGAEYSSWRTHRKTAKAKLDSKEIKNVNLHGLTKGYWEVWGNQARADSVSSDGEKPMGSNEISNPQNPPVLPLTEIKENKDEETDGADLRPDQKNSGDETVKNAGLSQVEVLDESGKSAGMKASQQKKKKKKKSKGAKPKLDDDWNYLQSLEQEQNTETPPENDLGGVDLKDEKEGQGTGISVGEEIKEGFQLPGPTEKLRKAYINGPVFQALNAALMPYTTEKDQIYPGLPRPKSQRKPTTDDFLEKRLETWKTDVNPSRMPGADYVNLWRKLHVDLDLMDSISRYMKVFDKTFHLSLSDLDIHTYEALREVWHRPEDRIKFLVHFQWWMPDVLSDHFEFHRRIKTLVKQVSERTVVENWRLIREHLVKNQKLTPLECNRIETFYSLTIPFPKSPESADPQLPEKLLVPKRKHGILYQIKESLGINTSNTFTRTEQIGPENFQEESIIARNFEELQKSSRLNGLEITQVLHIIAKFKMEKHMENYSFNSSEKVFWDFVNDALTPWHFSAEQHWLRKYYPSVVVDRVSNYINRGIMDQLTYMQGSK
ncbi:hypothetical protein PTTG_25996 [Puccinia triticina 1-1 BBBD Race 1]|uniref:Uncharacterized protein n=1 Tax=Puccinia triticina (isolate 1-1 / race 1 (BBBD)) TaxID=630390 RepID=A0A180GXM8_PUCT1|nr:hypothetical protein PTTG_25996 [Puccinia triticina 1-1 BBBD Race 1]